MEKQAPGLSRPVDASCYWDVMTCPLALRILRLALGALFMGRLGLWSSKIFKMLRILYKYGANHFLSTKGYFVCWNP
jgi:hypothetical protein